MDQLKCLTNFLKGTPSLTMLSQPLLLDVNHRNHEGGTTLKFDPTSLESQNLMSIPSWKEIWCVRYGPREWSKSWCMMRLRERWTNDRESKMIKGARQLGARVVTLVREQGYW